MRELLREYMDYSDIETVHQLSLLSEANQNQFLVSLTSKLYDKIREKATKIDFSSVEMSRGDITKIQNYASMIECLQLIRRIVLEYKQDPGVVDEVLKADQNLRDRIKLFKKAFAIGSSLPILVYDTTALSLVEATSFLITVCIEYVKDPAMETVQMAVDVAAYNKTRQNLLFTSLQEFNKACTDKSLDNAMNLVMSQAVVNRETADLADVQAEKIEKDHPFITDEDLENGNLSVVHDEKDVVQEGIRDVVTGVGSALSYGATKIILWICKKLIPIVRTIVYYYYFNRQKASNYYSDQADILQINAMNLKYNDALSPEEKRSIYEKQMKLVEKFRAKANRLSIDYTVAKKNADKLANDEAKKFRAEEVQDDSNINYASIFEAEMNNDLGKLIFESPFEPASLEDRVEYFEEGFIKNAIKGVHDIIKGLNKSKKNKSESDKKHMTDSIDKSENVKVEYKVVNNKGELDSLYKSEALVYEGLNIKKEDADNFVAYLDKTYGVSEKKLTIYAFDGKLMNSVYDLHDKNKYPDDIHFTGLPLDAFVHKYKGAPAYYSLKGRGFRYFNDIVDNNEYREYINGYHEKSDQIKWIINVLGDKK